MIPVGTIDALTSARSARHANTHTHTAVAEAQALPVAVAGTLLGAAFDHCDIDTLDDTVHVGDPVILLDYISSWPPDRSA